MRKFLFLVVAATFAFAAHAQSITIAAARALPSGSVVTVEGTVSCNTELGVTLRYIQDGTGAMAIYGNPVGVGTVGSVVRTTGTLVNYKGICEMSPTSSCTVLSTGAAPTPLATTYAGVNEANEGLLIKIPSCTFTATGNFVYTAAGYTVNTPTGSFLLFLRNGHPLIGTPIPSLPVSITGVSSQFDAAAATTDNWNTSTTGYQLLPRSQADFEGLLITAPVTQTNTTTSSFSLNWTSNLTARTGVKYGLTTALELGFVAGGTNTATPTVALSGFQPAQVVYARAFSAIGVDTAWASRSAFITTSTSTGTIQVYFNKAVDLAVATPGNNATELNPVDYENLIINLINNAQTSIDCAVYNANRVPITNALNAAHQRGVKVRYVYDIDEANTALASALFPKIGVNSVALMHDKYLVVDANSVNNSYVLSGSTNWTDNQIVDDNNNIVIIQDQSLARAYELEQNEMWGGVNAQPFIGWSKSGADKADNTPHFFKIGGKNVEMYFSPSDATESKIINAINTADASMQFALLTFTSTGIATAIRSAKLRGVDCKGLVDNINDTNSQVPYLNTNNIPTYDARMGAIFHHKYAVIDAANLSSDPTVVTGSHNWSSSANSRNDENTLIIHDANITNQFWQSFNASWTIVTATTAVENINGMTATLMPNPANGETTLQLEKGTKSGAIQVELYNAVGQQMSGQTVNYNANDTQSLRLNLNGLATGTYFVVLKSDDKVMARKLSVN
jgi:phosphatidylserine/phosphatidylglycerophosphate/cardiolipin synthase-like enzyme